MSQSDLVTTLRQFHVAVYQCSGARRNALFELLDATTAAGLVPPTPRSPAAATPHAGSIR